MKLARRLQLFSSSFMMSHSKIAAGRNGAHRFKSAATTALVLSAMAGSVMLSSAEVKASTTTCVPPSGTSNMDPGPATCTTTGDPIGTFTNKATIIQYATNADGIIAGTAYDFEGTGLNYPISQQQIDTDFNFQGAGGNYTGGLGTSIYKVEALTPGFPIDGIDLSASGIGAFTVKKEVFSDLALTNKIAELNLTGSGFVPVVPIAPINQIYIRDTFNNPTSGASSIDNVENTLRNVPGPLPILGAGAAFGFSRKLRGRIKAARLG